MSDLHVSPEYMALVAANHEREEAMRLRRPLAQPDDPGVRPFHLDFASHDAALMARTWRIAFFSLLAGAIFLAAVLGPYYAKNWTRISHAIACSEEVI